MARKQDYTPPQKVLHELDSQRLQYGLDKINRRIQEIEEYRIEERTEVLSESDRQRIEQKVNSTLAEVFGENSDEYDEYKVDLFAFHDGVMSYRHQESPHEKLQKQKDRLPTYTSKLKNLAELMQERLDELGAGTSLQTYEARFDSLHLHNEVQLVAGKLFKDGHYSQAVFEAVKKLELYIKFKANYGGNKTGTQLMREIFSRNNPILKFNSLQTREDMDEQEGIEHILAGVMLFIRNPRGHLIKADEAERALNYLSLISLLFDLTDESSL